MLFISLGYNVGIFPKAIEELAMLSIPGVDVPAVVNGLMTFFVMGGTDAALDMAKGIVSGTAVKAKELVQLKDELLEVKDVALLLNDLKQQPQNEALQQALRALLTEQLQQHATTQIAAQAETVSADKGSEAAVVMKDVSINKTNHFS